MNWREFLRNEPLTFTDAITLNTKHRKWKELLGASGVDVVGLPRSIKDFVKIWEPSDFKHFIEGNSIKSIWHLERKSRTVFKEFVKKDSEGEITELLPYLRSRKRWSKIEISEAWIDEYLSLNPSLRILKQAPQGLRKKLREIGMYDYFRKGVERRSFDRVKNVAEEFSFYRSIPPVATFFVCPLIFDGSLHFVMASSQQPKAIKVYLEENGDDTNSAYLFLDLNLCRCAQSKNLNELVQFLLNPFSAEANLYNSIRIKEMLVHAGIESYATLDIYFPNVAKFLLLRGLYYHVGLNYD